jgi:ribosomal protein S18 acetylase RimI-like enzyme
MADIRNTFIRELFPDDRPRIQEMLTASAVFTPAEVQIALNVFDDGVRSSASPPPPAIDLSPYCHFGLIDANQLVAYAAVGETPCTESTWHLYWICVHPHAHRRGHARRLLTHAESFIRSHRGTLLVIETSSRPHYAPARSLYQSLGYTQVGQISNFYRSDDDCLLYAKPFV